MNARQAPGTRQVGEDDAITTRIGAVALPLGVILFVVVTAIFHPHREAPMDNPAVFMEYAESDSWVAILFSMGWRSRWALSTPAG